MTDAYCSTMDLTKAASGLPPDGCSTGRSGSARRSAGSYPNSCCWWL
jgi:hypothetical protein